MSQTQVHVTRKSHNHALGPIAQSVVSSTADPGGASLILTWSNTFVEIDHEMIPTVILLLLLIQEGLLSVSYKRKHVHKVLVNQLVKLAQEKVLLGELTVSTLL